VSALPPAEDSLHHRTHPGRRGGRKAPVIAALAVLGLGWTGLATSARMPYTCSACRMNRVDRSCFGVNWSEQQETDCSRWYAENVEPAHAHVWVTGTRCRSFGIPGIYGGYSCTIGGPITTLGGSRQIEIYRHFSDPFEAKRLFMRLGQWDAGVGATYDSLLEWAREGYPGTWTEWQEKHQATSP